MKRLLFILLAPLVMLTSCSSEPDEGSLYHRYADRKGVTVAEVDGFALNDSVRTDVVMLQAEDDAEWQKLCNEFDIRWIGDAGDPALRIEWNGAPAMRVIASPSKRAIGFYRLQDESQYDALLDYQLNKLKNK